MMTYKIQVDDVVRDATAEEAAVIDTRVAEAEARADALADKAVAREALLERLGITDEEARMLLS